MIQKATDLSSGANAASVADETLIAEIRSLEQEWSQMRENVCHKICYSVLKKARPTYLEVS